jgi:hypothetical protein
VRGHELFKIDDEDFLWKIADNYTGQRKLFGCDLEPEMVQKV